MEPNRDWLVGWVIVLHFWCNNAVASYLGFETLWVLWG